jgi:cell division protein FtsX
MRTLHLAFKLGLGTLRSRPTLTILAVGLLALGTVVLGGLFGAIYLLRGLEGELMSGLSVEIELVAGLSEHDRTEIITHAEQWPGAEFVQYVPAEKLLDEIQHETGEDLRALFGSNPFPPIIRVQFGFADQSVLDSLTEAARQWEGVSTVAYPKKLWGEISRLMDRLTGNLGIAAFVFALIAVGLVGLCLRAQVRNRMESWEFLSLFGMSQATLNLALLSHELIVGITGGILACGILLLSTVGLSWLLLHTISFPIWFYLSICLLSIALSVLAGLFSPRRSFRF